MDLNTTGVLTWLLLGLVAGLLVHFIDRRDVPGGVVGTVALGILGALVGGWITNNFLGIPVTGFNLQSIIIATAGGLLLATLYRLLFSGRTETNRGRSYGSGYASDIHRSVRGTHAHRDAGSGEFTSHEEVKDNPDGTTTETIDR